MSAPEPTLADDLAHAICPKLKPWLDSADSPPHQCKRCVPFDTNYGRAVPACLLAAREIAAAVTAWATGDAAVERMAAGIAANDGAPWGELADKFRANYLKRARAAVAALLGARGEDGDG